MKWQILSPYYTISVKNLIEDECSKQNQSYGWSQPGVPERPGPSDFQVSYIFLSSSRCLFSYHNRLMIDRQTRNQIIGWLREYETNPSILGRVGCLLFSVSAGSRKNCTIYYTCNYNVRDFNILVVMRCVRMIAEGYVKGYQSSHPGRFNLLPVLSTRETSRSLICLDLSPQLLIISIIE